MNQLPNSFKLFLRLTLDKIVWFFSRNDLKFCKKQYERFFNASFRNGSNKNFSEMLQFYKCFYRNPKMTLCADKIRVKEYLVEKGLGDLYIPLIASYSKASEIDWDGLVPPYVIKVNHLSGFNIVIKQTPSKREQKKIESVFNVLLHGNKYYTKREWCYKDIEPRLMIQKYIEPEYAEGLIDYKFYCFNGKVEYFMVSTGEIDHNVRNYKFSPDLKSVDHLFKKNSSMTEREARGFLPPIEKLKEMLNVCDILCRDFPHVRVDLLYNNGMIHFGELTFYSNGGYVNVYSDEENNRLGQLMANSPKWSALP